MLRHKTENQLRRRTRSQRARAPSWGDPVLTRYCPYKPQRTQFSVPPRGYMEFGPRARINRPRAWQNGAQRIVSAPTCCNVLGSKGRWSKDRSHPRSSLVATMRLAENVDSSTSARRPVSMCTVAWFDARFRDCRKDAFLICRVRPFAQLQGNLSH